MAPAPVPAPPVSSAAPAPPNDVPAAEDDPDMCPIATANSAKPALREVQSDAVAPDPALLKRLTSAQRAELACLKTLSRDDVPSAAELASERALLGPLKHLVYDFISDGARFHPLSDPTRP